MGIQANVNSIQGLQQVRLQEEILKTLVALLAAQQEGNRLAYIALSPERRAEAYSPSTT